MEQTSAAEAAFVQSVCGTAKAVPFPLLPLSSRFAFFLTAEN
jgi:hypothetical protein